MIDLVPLGDRAFLARFADDCEAAAWASAVRSQRWEGIDDVVLAFASVAVYADSGRIELDALEAKLRTVAPGTTERVEGKLLTLPTLYDGEDLPEVARRLNLTEAEVIAAHSSQVYTVLAMGFLPGYPYAGYLPRVLSGLPRRAEPRVRVPAGSVAIADRQTGIYPSDSPGGWHLIGRTPLTIVDLAESFFPIEAGDRIRFAAIDRNEYEGRKGERL